LVVLAHRSEQRARAGERIEFGNLMTESRGWGAIRGDKSWPTVTLRATAPTRVMCREGSNATSDSGISPSHDMQSAADARSRIQLSY